MTDPIHTAEDALEAAALECERAAVRSRHDIAAAIRALKSRIAQPASVNDEALVEVVARAMQRKNRPKFDCRNRDQREAEADRDRLAAQVAGLREAAQNLCSYLENGDFDDLDYGRGVAACAELPALCAALAASEPQANGGGGRG